MTHEPNPWHTSGNPWQCASDAPKYAFGLCPILSQDLFCESSDHPWNFEARLLFVLHVHHFRQCRSKEGWVEDVLLRQLNFCPGWHIISTPGTSLPRSVQLLEAVLSIPGQRGDRECECVPLRVASNGRTAWARRQQRTVKSCSHRP